MREDRKKRHRDDQEAEEQRRSNLACGVDDDVCSRPPGRSTLQVLVRVLDHDDRGIDHRADGNCDAAETHDVRAQAQEVHAEIGDQHPDRQRDDGNERAADMQQEHHADEGDDGALLDQRPLERVDGAVDEVGAVVDRFNGLALREARRDLGETVLDVADHGQCVFPKPLQRYAGDDLAFAVHLGDTPALVGREFDPCHVLKQHRHAALSLDDDLLEVGQALDIAAIAFPLRDPMGADCFPYNANKRLKLARTPLRIGRHHLRRHGLSPSDLAEDERGVCITVATRSSR